MYINRNNHTKKIFFFLFVQLVQAGIIGGSVVGGLLLIGSLVGIGFGAKRADIFRRRQKLQRNILEDMRGSAGSVNNDFVFYIYIC